MIVPVYLECSCQLRLSSRGRNTASLFGLLPILFSMICGFIDIQCIDCNQYGLWWILEDVLGVLIRSIRHTVNCWDSRTFYIRISEGCNLCFGIKTARCHNKYKDLVHFQPFNHIGWQYTWLGQVMSWATISIWLECMCHMMRWSWVWLAPKGLIKPNEPITPLYQHLVPKKQ